MWGKEKKSFFFLWLSKKIAFWPFSLLPRRVILICTVNCWTAMRWICVLAFDFVIFVYICVCARFWRNLEILKVLLMWKTKKFLRFVVNWGSLAMLPVFWNWWLMVPLLKRFKHGCQILELIRRLLQVYDSR